MKEPTSKPMFDFQLTREFENDPTLKGCVLNSSTRHVLLAVCCTVFIHIFTYLSREMVMLLTSMTVGS
jgi:hypothetical protein